MSQRELLLLLAHTQMCLTCRDRLLAAPQAALAGHNLGTAERELLYQLKEADFFTPERLAAATGVKTAEINEYSNHPIVRLRHL